VRVFLTGGTGFVGATLIAGAPRDAEIAVLTRDPDAFRARAPELAARVELLRGDVTTFDPPRGASFTHVIHGAATRDTPDARETIIEGTRRVAEFARDAKRFLLISSGAVYAQTPDAYAEAKREAEQLVQKHVVIARLFTFVGPYLALDRGFAVTTFLRAALHGEPIRVEQPQTRRSYLYGSDLAQWLWTMLDRGEGVYDVGSDEAVTMRELAETIRRVVNPNIPITEGAGGNPSTYLPDIERAQRELGLRVTIPLEDAIRRTAHFFSS
jgi:UDP-glucuronate decarboxylase